MNESVLYRLKNLIDHNVISIHKNQFKIGRATTNDLAIENNRFISSIHCIFEYDNGRVLIRDTSSNGTLINRSKKIQKNDSPIELQSGDIIHLVFRKDEPGFNIIYQLDLSPITKSANQTEQRLKRKLSENTENSNNLSDANIDVELKRLKTNEALAMKAGDDMEDILTCVCCQDIMTNPICLEPCLHAFCNDCYSSWEAVQRSCPKCRAKVTGKKKNVVINGILEAFLKAYPHKRPVLKTIDNTTCSVNKNIQVNQNTMDDDDDDDEEEEEEDEDDNEHDMEEDDDDDENEMEDEDEEEEESEGHFVLMVTTPLPDVRFVCRQCPPIANRTNPNFQCRPGQRHIICQCCTQPMPDRQGEPNIHQSCEICHQYFCNLYYQQQCQRQNCLGCLNQLQNFNFHSRHLGNFVNDNPIETQIVQNYLTSHHLTIRELLVHCCQRLDRKEFICSNIDRNIPAPSTKMVCYQCGLKVFKELVLQFRTAMKMNEIFPVNLRNRENCYYGKKCRTQYTKPGHAQKLNHACEQTRFDR